MKFILKVAVLFIVFAVAAGYCAIADRKERRSEPRELDGSLDVEAMLWAIRQRESGDNPKAINHRTGERSAYQFTESTWRDLTPAPWAMATKNPVLANTVARRYLRFIRSTLARRGVEERPEYIGAAWNFGPAFALSAARTEYAQAVAALYRDRVTGRAAQ